MGWWISDLMQDPTINGKVWVVSWIVWVITSISNSMKYDCFLNASSQFNINIDFIDSGGAVISIVSPGCTGNF